MKKGKLEKTFKEAFTCACLAFITSAAAPAFSAQVTMESLSAQPVSQLDFGVYQLQERLVNRKENSSRLVSRMTTHKVDIKPHVLRLEEKVEVFFIIKMLENTEHQQAICEDFLQASIKAFGLSGPESIVNLFMRTAASSEDYYGTIEFVKNNFEYSAEGSFFSKETGSIPVFDKCKM